MLAAAAVFGIAWSARADEPPPPLPSFAELEAAGVRFGEIRVAARDIFDTSDPKEDNWLFRTANRLHIQTRPGVIERQLLFKSGEPVSVRLIEETERLLRSNRYLYDVQFRPLAVHDGVVDIEVVTRDTWSLDPGFSAGRSGGANSSGLKLREYNVFGTGTSISLGRSKDVDRTSTEFQFSNARAFGTWAAVDYEHSSNSDGKRNAASVVRPFYALELLDGRDFSELAPVPWRRACGLLRDVASALAFLHARQLLHRDVAPRNVRCTDDGRAKLIDFGMLATMGISHEVVGTLPAIPPEMLLGLPMDGRADLFGLGALAFWLLTGRHPQRIRSLDDLMRNGRRPPPAPSRLVSEIPPALDDLVLSLLSTEPLGRPSHAAEVIERLTALAELPAAPELEVAHGYVSSAMLVGRERELTLARRRIERAICRLSRRRRHLWRRGGSGRIDRLGLGARRGGWDGSLVSGGRRTRHGLRHRGKFRDPHCVGRHGENPPRSNPVRVREDAPIGLRLSAVQVPDLVPTVRVAEVTFCEVPQRVVALNGLLLRQRRRILGGLDDGSPVSTDKAKLIALWWLEDAVRSGAHGRCSPHQCQAPGH